MNQENHNSHPILLFDGVCNMCNSFIQWIIIRDKKGVIHYTSLQSDIGKELTESVGLSSLALDTVILIDQGKAYTKSDAFLRVLNLLGGMWKILTIFSIIPRPIRNAVYDFIASNRYAWFGKKASCMMPRPEWENRFIK